jgi:RimJ/RimL family protein N-acetyltransferase
LGDHAERAETVIGWFFIGTSDSDCVGERSFGYLLDCTWWNRDYMTEALGVVLSFEFGALGTSRVHATCETANRASARVMEEVGMRHEKTVHDADFEDNWAERHHYAITQGEYGELEAEAGVHGWAD